MYDSPKDVTSRVATYNTGSGWSGVILLLGIVGAVIAAFLFPAMGLAIGAEGSIIGSIIYATIGAVILLLIIRLVNRA